MFVFTQIRTRPQFAGLGREERRVGGSPWTQAGGIVLHVGMRGNLVPLHGVARAMGTEDGVGGVGQVGAGVLGGLGHHAVGVVAWLVARKLK